MFGVVSNVFDYSKIITMVVNIAINVPIALNFISVIISDEILMPKMNVTQIVASVINEILR